MVGAPLHPDAEAFEQVAHGGDAVALLDPQLAGVAELGHAVGDEACGVDADGVFGEVDGLARRDRRHESLRIQALHALRPFQIQEMRERIGAERQQPELHAAGQVVAAAREVRPAQRRRRADRGHHVEHQRQV